MLQSLLRKIGAAAVCVAAFLLPSVNSCACTGVSFVAADGSKVLARSIEWANQRLDSRYVAVPRGHRSRSLTPDGAGGMEFVSKYGYVGVSVISDDLMVEGMNEKGLSAGLFFFPDYGGYQEYDPAAASSTLCDFQFVSWVLGRFETVDQVQDAVKNVRIVALDQSIGTVHWRLADKNGRQVVMEIVGGEVHFFENTVGVLTNSPGFEWHLTNLNNYLNISPGSAANKSWPSQFDTRPGSQSLRPMSGGSGMAGLPGDPTSVSRFVRMAVYRATAVVPATGIDAVMQCFKLLEAMVVPIGTVVDVNLNSEKPSDMITSTQFTTAADLDGMKFYYRTMDNSAIRCIDLGSIDFRKVKYQSHPLDDAKEQIQKARID